MNPILPIIKIGVIKVNAIQNSGSINIGYNVLSINSNAKANRGSGETFGDSSTSPIGTIQLNDQDLFDFPISLGEMDIKKDEQSL